MSHSHRHIKVREEEEEEELEALEQKSPAAHDEMPVEHLYPGELYLMAGPTLE